MAFSNSNSAGAPMCDINTTPLVDVMLVLLIIFMITAPMMTNKSDAKVPMLGPPQTDQPKPPTIYTVDVLASSSTIPQLAFEGVPISMPELKAKLKVEAAKGEEAMPDINIRTAPDANYEHMARTLALINETGIKKVRFDELNPAGLVPGAAAAAAPQ
jgi:biopolymer transport protein ExbD